MIGYLKTRYDDYVIASVKKKRDKSWITTTVVSKVWLID